MHISHGEGDTLRSPGGWITMERIPGSLACSGACCIDADPSSAWLPPLQRER